MSTNKVILCILIACLNSVTVGVENFQPLLAQPVPNGGFEILGPEGVAQEWRLEANDPNNLAEVSERHAKTGKRSLHLKAGEEAKIYCDAISEGFPVKERTKYWLNFYVHGSGNVFTHFYDTEGKELGEPPYYGFSGRRFEKTEIEFSTPAGAQNMTLRFRVYPPQGEAWIDEVKVTEFKPAKLKLSVPNPSFEMLDLEGNPVGWELQPTHPDNVAEASAEQARFGKRSLHLRATKEGKPYCDAVSGDFAIEANVTYTLSFYAKAPKNSGVFTFVYDREGNEVGSAEADASRHFFFSTKEADWERVVIKFTPNPNAARMHLQFRVYPPDGECWVDGVQIEEGEATEFNAGAPLQVRLLMSREVYLRGGLLKVPVICLNQTQEPRKINLRLTVSEGRNKLKIYEQPVEMKPYQEVIPSFNIATEELSCGQYRLKVELLEKKETLTSQEAEFVLVSPAKESTIGYGFYGYVIEGCGDKRFPALPFVPDNIDRGLDLIASAKMNVFNGILRRPKEMFTYFLDGALKRGIKFLPLLNLYFGKPARSPEEFALDAQGERIYVHTSKDLPNLSLISPSARKQAAEGTKEALKEVKDHPAFAGKFYFGDDVAMWRGKPDIYRGPLQDYSPVALSGFKQKTGLEAPKRTAEELNKTRGVLPDNDPWLLWMRFRCEDILAGYQETIIRAKNEIVPEAKGGPQHGAVWWPGVGAVPSYELKVVDLLTYYEYPEYPPYHLFHSELAFLGGREKELWATPSAHNNIWGKAFEERTPEYERSSFFSLLSAGAKGITYCPFQSEAQFTEGHPAVWEEFRRQGEIVEKHGKLLYQLRKVRGKIGLLISFSTSAYRVYEIMKSPAYEDSHSHSVAGTFFALLRAQLPVEIVDEEEILSGAASKYKVLLLADVQVLPESVYAKLVDYVKGGGKLFLDDYCLVDIPGAAKLKTHFDAHPMEETLTEAKVREAVAEVRRIFYRLVPPIIRCDSEDLAVREFEAAGVRYLMLLNLRVEEPLVANLTLPMKEFAIYDVFAGQILSDGQVRLRGGEGKLLAFIPKGIAQLVADISPCGVQTRSLKCNLRVLDAKGKLVEGLQPLEVRFIDPAGEEHKEYGGYLVAKGGSLSLSVIFALNDPPGKWTVIVKELLSGKGTIAQFTLLKALDCHWKLVRAYGEEGQSVKEIELTLKNNLEGELQVEIIPIFTEGVKLVDKLSPFSLNFSLKPNQVSVRQLKFFIEDEFYSGAVGGELQVRFEEHNLIAFPVFFVFAVPESPKK